MTKFMSFVLSFLLFFDFFGCAALRVKFAEKAGLENIQVIMVNPQYDEDGKLFTCDYELHWNDNVYEKFGTVSENSMAGKLFGLTDMNGSTRVFVAADQSPEDWLIWVFGDFMGVWFLCKEKNVAEIPDGFVSFMNE